MNTIKNKLIFFCFLVTFFVTAGSVSNSTEHLLFKINDVSFNIFTLTVFADDFLIKETLVTPRDVLKIGKLKISLELARSLLLWRFQIDCFYLENVYLNIFEDDEGNDFLFDKKISEKEVDELFGEKNIQTNKKTKTELDLSIPFLEIKNVNISCNDYKTKKFLWSIDNLNLYIYDFIYPPEKNSDLWNTLFSAYLNHDTNCTLFFSAKCRTVPNDSYLKLKIAANKIDWKSFDMILGSGKKVAKRPESAKVKNTFSEESSPFTAIINSFSNEINLITYSLDEKIKDARADSTVSNFFNQTSESNLVFYFDWDMEISNHIFKSGNVRLKMLNAETNLPPLIFEYKITNSTQILLPYEI